MPEPDLSTYSAEALVDAIIRLTHRVHVYDEAGVDDAADNARAQRDLARAELLRRCRHLETLRVSGEV
jgi:hypothetical protein